MLLCSLPEGLSTLVKLKKLQLRGTAFREPPISVLSHLTALNTIDLSLDYAHNDTTAGIAFSIPSPLLPILHPGLVKLDLRHKGLKWDPISQCHLGRALADMADRKPVPTLLFKW
jgi:hypothetical protein